MRLRPGLGGLVLGMVMTSGMAVAAGPPDAERLKIAAEEFDAGRRAYKVKDFENAAVHFENADRDAPSPEALQSAVRARKEATHIARAATLAAWGLARYPTDKTFGDYARQLVGDAEKSLHKVNLSCVPDCTVVVDNKVMPFPEGPNAVVYLDAGPHTVIAGWGNNRHKSSEVVAISGGSSKVQFNAAAGERANGTDAALGSSDSSSGNGESQVDRGTEDEKKSGLPPAIFFVGLGTTVLLGGITAWSGIDTINDPGNDKVEDCIRQGKPACDPAPLIDKGVSNERRTNVLIGVTSVVAATTGIIALFFTNWGDETPQTAKKEASIIPVVGVSNGVTLGAVGRF